MTRPRQHDHDDEAAAAAAAPERAVGIDTGGRRFRAGHRGDRERVAASIRRRAEAPDADGLGTGTARI